jgi:4-amino-4-deoxy-L-arabinose transferase-like glycosyltransferase
MGDAFSYVSGGGGLPIDSYNDAVFSLGARALAENGPIDAKLGGAWGGGDRYADHPPLIYSATAASQALVGSDEVGARGLAFVASVAAMVLLFLLLRELDVAPVLAALCVGVGLCVPMFVAYGTMLDTLMVGLPFGVGYLLLWQRSIDDRGNVAALGCAAALAALVAWEGALLVAVTLVATVMLRRDRRGWRTVRAAATGLAVGVVITLGWLLWVFGSFEEFINKGLLRANGAGPASLGSYLEQEWKWLRALFGVPAVVLLICGLAAIALLRRFRPVGISAFATSLIYAGAFRQGSWQHDYWNYWLLVTVVVGAGAIASIVSRARRHFLTGAACALAVAVVVMSFTAATPIYLRTGGRDLAAQLAATRQPVPGQRWIPVVPVDAQRPGTSAVWDLPQARFYLRAPLRYATPAEATAFVQRHPTFWVVVHSEVLRGRDALTLLASA